ncbi:unnamed protein product, partial [Phaeothamnion confervicola]
MERKLLAPPTAGKGNQNSSPIFQFVVLFEPALTDKDGGMPNAGKNAMCTVKKVVGDKKVMCGTLLTYKSTEGTSNLPGHLNKCHGAERALCADQSTRSAS